MYSSMKLRSGQLLGRNVLRLSIELLFCVGLCFSCIAAPVDEPIPSRAYFSETNTEGYVTRLLLQQNRDHGGFEVKVTDKNGNVTQWYQHFVDENGKEIISIIRVPSGRKDSSDYESIRSIRYNSYRPDGNISGYYEFDGDGVLHQRVEYKYDEKGKWLVGIMYNSKGKKIGEEMTPPETWLYGTKK